MTDEITFTPAKRDELRAAYEKAQAAGVESFVFEGSTLLVSYAKYLLGYLDSVFAGAPSPSPRAIWEIAQEIKMDWKRPYFGAAPYLTAMLALNRIEDSYGADSARTIVRYFLSNASTWRGPVAKRVKAELKKLLEQK